MRKLTGLIFLLLSYSMVNAGTRTWVYFDSKPAWNGDQPTRYISPRAVTRRLKSRSPEQVIDIYDIPVNPRYVEEVRRTGARIHQISRYFNAVSVEADERQLAAIREFPFVRKTAPVRGGRRHEPQVESPKPQQIVDENYGNSYNQLAQIQVPQLHAAGYHGEGILIGHNDTGVFLDHEAFAELQILATWDFINNDPVVQNEEGDDPGQHVHGTYTLSTIGGKVPGVLYGPAYEATYVIAKTEDVTSETPIEEDNWVAAIEWEDSLGVDVTTTSLGYLDWYTYEDMDGNTAVITVAADIAAAHGIAVFNSAGNEGSHEWYYIIAPADGDSVIAVGAVGSDGELTGFSSHGPTYDGRIKPDVLAMGLYTYCASASGVDLYTFVSGTSLSCPLAAGVGALILQAHPQWNNMDLLAALRATGTNAETPDNDYGWGIIQGWAAQEFGRIHDLTIVYSGSELELSWGAVESATYYGVEYSNDPFAGFTEIMTTESTSVILLLDSTRGFYRVVAHF